MFIHAICLKQPSIRIIFFHILPLNNLSTFQIRFFIYTYIVINIPNKIAIDSTREYIVINIPNKIAIVSTREYIVINIPNKIAIVSTREYLL